MNMRLLLVPFLLASPVLSFPAEGHPASDVDTVPVRSLATKKELLFSDDFNSADHDKRWHPVVDTFTFEKGMLKGSQTREKDMPSPDGKSIITAHAAVYGLELPTKDSVVECKIRFEGATMLDFDDLKVWNAEPMK